MPRTPEGRSLRERAVAEGSRVTLKTRAEIFLGLTLEGEHLITWHREPVDEDWRALDKELTFFLMSRSPRWRIHTPARPATLSFNGRIDAVD